jgi:two-component system, NarL family, nitrate/nitrite response regulator NarL
VKVLIVDDHALFAESLRILLERHGMEVLGIAESASKALEAVRDHRPDVVLLDLGLPDRPGLILGRQILEQLPDAKVVAVTSLDDSRIARDVMASGLHGYLSKTTSFSQFIRAVRGVMNGQTVVVGRRERVGHRWSPREEHNAAFLAGQLTARELEVLEILVQGGSNSAVARELGLSPNTVRTHVQSILSKLQVKSRLEAAAFAVRFDIVRPREAQHV